MTLVCLVSQLFDYDDDDGEDDAWAEGTVTLGYMSQAISCHDW